MTSRRLTWWIVFAFCTTAVAGAMAWVTAEVVRLESAELRARADAAQQEALRLALWRMDSWFAPHFAREATRPYHEYLPYYSHERAYTRLLNAIEPHEVHSASPLLSFRSDLFLLHFQAGADGAVTSPQVPTGNLRDLAEGTGLPAAQIEAKKRVLDRLLPLLADFATVDRALAEAEASLEVMEGASATEPLQIAGDVGQLDEPEGAQVAKSRMEQSRRAQSYDWAQEAVSPGSEMQLELPSEENQTVRIGRLAPILARDLGGSDPRWDETLLLIRRVRVGGQIHLQGTLMDLPSLRRALADRVEDLFPAADFRVLRGVAEMDAAAGRAMALIPVALVVEGAVAEGSLAHGWTPSRVMLAVAWGAILIAVLATGITLHASIAYGERRSRFASAVTHELRTPLTTFRMYSEMLAEGMVPDGEQKASYLQALRSEADRLSALVENVLAYARLERGRAEITPQRMDLRALLDRLIPALRRRAEEADLELHMAPTPDEVAVRFDADAAGQILFNLVDNACKYARSGGRIDLTVRKENGWVNLEVRDHGRGVSPEHSRRIFHAFDRGERDPGDTTPGVGLGLALSRGLARKLGGDLTLDRACRSGACFRLTLPRAE